MGAARSPACASVVDRKLRRFAATIMQLNSFVIVNLHSPSERFVGRLIDVNAAGATLCGLDIEAFEDWIHAILSKDENGVRPTTVFFPLPRIEKIILDEDVGPVSSLQSQFLERVGAAIDDYLE